MEAFPGRYINKKYEELGYYTGVMFDRSSIDDLLDDNDGALCWGSGMDWFIAKMNFLVGGDQVDKKVMVSVFLFQ